MANRKQRVHKWPLDIDVGFVVTIDSTIIEKTMPFDILLVDVLIHKRISIVCLTVKTMSASSHEFMMMCTSRPVLLPYRYVIKTVFKESNL